MPAVETTSFFLNGILEVVVRFRGMDGIDYYKGVPQTAFPMLGLGVRKDMYGAHSYLYQGASEVSKESLRWDVPKDCLFRVEVTPESPVRIRLPQSTSTFSALAIGTSKVSVYVRREEGAVELAVDRRSTVFFAAFEGGYLDWRAIQTSGYASSAYSPPREGT